MKLLRCVVILLPLALLLIACGSGSGSSAQQIAPPLDYATLVERLRADGATVEPAGDASAYPLVTPLGGMIHLNGERAMVFEYRDARLLRPRPRMISPDGTARTWEKIQIAVPCKPAWTLFHPVGITLAASLSSTSER